VLENIPPESDYGLTSTSLPSTTASRWLDIGSWRRALRSSTTPKGNQNVYTSLRGNGRYPAGQLVEEALIRLDSGRVNITVYHLSQAGEQDSDLEGGFRTACDRSPRFYASTRIPTPW